MALLSVITAPDARLKATSVPVDGVDEEVRALMDNLLETMYGAPGVGLAAPQVGVQTRVIVIDVAEKDETPEPFRLANPKIVWASEETILCEEGCLSVPEFFAEVSRAQRIRLRYLDHDNSDCEIEPEGRLAACIQHEIDHLDGILFIDYLSVLKRRIILRKLIKARKLQAQKIPA
ncbi:MAG: peptide deformylase [Proteobacteria bacterium]|nr:peptide deformylase [Pseudomonadota bacterium]